MAVTTQLGDTPYLVAQRALGNGNLAPQLSIPGWISENVHEPLQEGVHVYLPEERTGPPAVFEAARNRWGAK